MIPLFAAAALAGRSPTIFGDGEQSRDFTHVSNVVRANMLALEAGEAALGEVVNIGAGDRTTINELWRTLRELAGAEVEAEHVAPRPGDVRHSLASLEETERLIGYRPEVDVREGLARTFEWYRTHLGA